MPPPSRLPSLALALLLIVAACTPGPGRRPPSSSNKPPVSAAKTTTPKPAKWTARRVIADAKTVNGQRRHTVKPGETGIAIARAYGVPWPELVAANSLTPPYLLEVGDTLRLPSRQTVAARPLEDRARAFTIDIDTLITGAEPAAVKPRPTSPTTPAPTIAPTPKIAPTPTIAFADAPAFRWPVDGRIVSAFGPKPAGRFNDGVNLKTTAGAPVRAAADGTVAYAGDAITGFGNLVLIRHPGGWVTAYGHNESLLVERGKIVRAGDIIARAGQTGAVAEPQLHFEIRRGRAAIDPVKLLPPR